MGKVGHLSDLHDEYFDRGFRVVAISGESDDLLRKEMIDEREATYWIGSDRENRTLSEFSHDFRVGIPRFYLVDARGKVVGDGIPSEEELEKLLANTYDLSLDRELHEKLARARSYYDGGAYGAAWKAAKRVLDDRKTGEQATADAKFLCDKIERLAEFTKETVTWRTKSLDPDDEYGTYVELELEFAGLPLAKWADRQARDLRRNPEVKEYRKAWRKFQSALKRELRARGSEYDLGRARETYEKIIEEYPRAAAARFAQERIEEYLSGNR